VAESCVEHLALVVSSCHPKARILLRLDFAHLALQRSIVRQKSARTGHWINQDYRCILYAALPPVCLKVDHQLGKLTNYVQPPVDSPDRPSAQLAVGRVPTSDGI